METLNKNKLIKELNDILSKPASTDVYYNLTISRACNLIRDSGRYDFFVKSEDIFYSLYLRLYNNKGVFYNNKLWGTYSSSIEILEILRNIIVNEV